MAANQNLTYRRAGSRVTLKLSGEVDIYVAATLHELARRALADAKAQSVYVEMSHVERLDASALQILCALKHDLDAAGREFHTTGLASELTGRLSGIGISL